VAASCENGNEPSGGRKFFDQLSDYQHLKGDSAPWTSLPKSTALPYNMSFSRVSQCVGSD
jgi:hypothetical protein